MSIDLSVVCLQRPDAAVSERVAHVLLRRVEPPVDIAAVGVYEVPPDRHEFDGQHVLSFEPAARTPAALLTAYVLAAVTALLYRGDVLDEAGIFPTLHADELFRTCTCGAIVTADELWAGLG